MQVKQIFILVGLGMIFGAIYTYFYTQSFLKDASFAKGKVIELVLDRSSTSNNTSYTYKPLIKFMTEDEQTIEFLSSVGSKPPSYSVGDPVEVLYRKNDPYNAKVNSFFAVWGIATILTLMGCLFFAIGVFSNGSSIKYYNQSQT